MAIALNNSDAMNNFGYYCKQIKDYVNMKKYYIMAIELDHTIEEKEIFNHKVLKEGSPLPKMNNYCPNCGSKLRNQENLKFCEECGEKL